MRETCLFCVSKHLAEATILLGEVPLGYSEHLWLAVGHLAEAEAESVSDHPDLAKRIRAVRLILMGQDTEGCIYPDTMMNLIREARKIAEKVNGISEFDRIQNIMCKHRDVRKERGENLG